MSALFESVGKQVLRDGCLKFGERRFWSPDSTKFAGKWVSVRLPGAEDQMVTFWDGPEETARKYVAYLIADCGFASSAAAKEAARRSASLRGRIREYKSSVVRSQAALLLELVEHTGENRRLGVRGAAGRLLRALKDRLLECIGKAGDEGAEHVGGGNLEGGDGVDARLQLALRIFELGQFGLGDQGFPPANDGLEPNPPADGAHRLSGVAK